MAGLGGPPVLVPTISMYRAYFSSPETNPFSGDYQKFLEPYPIDPMNARATQTPASVYQQVYSASQQGYPTAFLMWNDTPGKAKDCDPGRVILLQSISHYMSRMGRPARWWDDRTFANRGDVSYGTVSLAVWDPTYPHLSPAVYVPSAAAIDTSLARDPTIHLLGPYVLGDAVSENIHCCKTVYVLAP